MTKLFLTDGVQVQISHASPVELGGTEYRIILDIISHIPDPNRIIKHYEVWVTEEYLEDKTQFSPDLDGAIKFAIYFIKFRFKESGNIVPEEFKAVCQKGNCNLI
jgi:hypothetical protein